MRCPTKAPPPFHCPTLIESIAATAALWPRGRAWPARDLALLPRFLQWLGELVGVPARGDWPAGFVQVGYTAALGAVRNFLETQLCLLRLEFWCATKNYTTDLWMLEYGLPDDCDPFPDLCVKVAAIGGRRCELYQALVARRGWVIECLVSKGCEGVGVFAGSGFAGNIRLASVRVPSHVVIVVYLGLSSAYTGAALLSSTAQHAPPPSITKVFAAGNIYAGQAPTCATEITVVTTLPPPPLQCLIERIVPAHVVVDYVVQWAPG